MKHTYKLIFLTLIAITSHTASAELDYTDTSYSNSEAEAKPRLQLKLFPGIARTPKRTIAMPMVEPKQNQTNYLNLNNSLDKPIQTNKAEKYLDDIEVSSNNILELRFFTSD